MDTTATRPGRLAPIPTQPAGQDAIGKLDALEAAMRDLLTRPADLSDPVHRALARQVVDATSAAAAARPDQADICSEKLRRIRRLHDQLCLHLRQERQDVRAQGQSQKD